MKKTIENCKTIEKQSYYYAKPKVIDGKCEGYCSTKKPYNLLSACQKCKFLYIGEQGEDT